MKPTAAQLCDILKNITDQSILDKVDSLLSEPAYDELLEKINEDKNNSFSESDIFTIKSILLNANGTSTEKRIFLQSVLDTGILDISKIIKLNTVVDIDDSKVSKLPAAATKIYNEVKTQILNAKYSLRSASAIGVGEAFLILFCKKVSKGRIGDLSYKNKDWEIKAKGARWASARAKPGPMNSIKRQLARRLNVDPLKINFTFKKRDMTDIADINKLGVTPQVFVDNFADVLSENFNGADASGFRNPTWITDTNVNNRANLFSIAYTKMLTDFYQQADDWGYLSQLNQDKLTMITWTGPNGPAKSVEDGTLNMDLSALTSFTGSNDARSISPQYSLK